MMEAARTFETSVDNCSTTRQYIPFDSIHGTVTHSGFSISQWNFITLRVQYTTLDYSPQLF
jgi:hypothetical protein